MTDPKLPTPTPPPSPNPAPAPGPTPAQGATPSPSVSATSESLKPPPSALKPAPGTSGLTSGTPPVVGSPPTQGVAAPTPPAGALPTAVRPLPAPTPPGAVSPAVGSSNPSAPLPGNIPSQPPRPAGTPPLAGTPPVGSPPPTNPNIVEKAGADGNKKTTSGPTFAKVKASPFKFLPFIVGGLIVLGVIIFALTQLFGAKKPASVETKPTNTESRKTVPTKEVSLTYWGLWEPDTVLTGVFQDYEKANPGVKVNYIKQSHVDYRERLQTAIASGNGPDLFRYHATWVSMLKNELAPLPQSVMSATEFKSTFYPVASQQLQSNGQIVGIPLMYDGLALYYNKEHLQAAGAEPPKTWAELRTLAVKLTVASGGEVQRGGLAIGTATNVEHFSDILGLLLLQNGADPSKPTTKEARDALIFYTNFMTQDKVWSEKLPSSTVAFARGDVAMMFAPSWRVFEIKAMNPELQFGITAAPKLSTQDVTWASYWAEGVSAQGKNKEDAWKLLKYLSSKEVQLKLHSAQSGVRAFGEIYSRVDLADQLAGNELVAPYLKDAPMAQSWYLASYTHDKGINDQMIKYYQDAVIAIMGGRDAADSLTTVDQGTKQVLRQYGATSGN